MQKESAHAELLLFSPLREWSTGKQKDVNTKRQKKVFTVGIAKGARVASNCREREENESVDRQQTPISTSVKCGSQPYCFEI